MEGTLSYLTFQSMGSCEWGSYGARSTSKGEIKKKGSVRMEEPSMVVHGFSAAEWFYSGNMGSR